MEAKERIDNQWITKDPLLRLRTKAARIESLLQEKGQRLTVSILGTLHSGHISDQIKALVDDSDLVTVELPSIAVNSSGPSKNEFWREILLEAKSRGKEIVGVNNNFAAVNTLRFLNGGDYNFRIPQRDQMDSGLVGLLDFYADETEKIFGPYAYNYPDFFDLSLMAVSHLVRLCVDKSQMNLIVKKLVGVLIGKRTFSDVKVLHVGGAGHNPNLLAIADDIFTDEDVVLVSEIKDKRVPDFATDEITYFAQLIPAKNGLVCTQMRDDRVFIVRERALEVLSEAMRVAEPSLRSFYLRQSTVKEFGKVVGYSNSQLEKFVINYLLSLVELRDFSDLPQIDQDLPKHLVDYINGEYPWMFLLTAVVSEVLATRPLYFPEG